MRYSHNPEPKYARLAPVAGGLAFESTYDSAMVAEFKIQIPADSRRWDPAGKRWIVSPQYGSVCAKIAEQFLGVQVLIPTQTHMPNVVESRLLKLEYLGRCKERGTGDNSAFGWCNGSWSLIFPEQMLREWFEAITQSPGEKPTLYAVLTVKSDATPDEIKKSFRRLAFQWHPDRCHEPDATEQFKIINNAYEVLSDELKRRKYNAGLALEASLKNPQRSGLDFLMRRKPTYTDPLDGYRPPLRCGWVLCTGKENLGRFMVGSILQWADIVDSQNRTMIVSWPAGATAFEVNWQ